MNATHTVVAPASGDGKGLDEDEMQWRIDFVLPPEEGVDYETLPPVVAAMEECRVLQDGNDVSVFDDEEVGCPVVEILGRKACVSLVCDSIHPFLCLHTKILEKYFTFEVEIVDDTKHYRQLHISNHRSLAAVDGEVARLPLKVGEGWQYINVDLERVTRLAFGTGYLTASCVTLRASARVARVFFQDGPYSDAELPRALQASPSQPCEPARH